MVGMEPGTLGWPGSSGKHRTRPEEGKLTVGITTEAGTTHLSLRDALATRHEQRVRNPRLDKARGRVPPAPARAGKIIPKYPEVEPSGRSVAREERASSDPMIYGC